VDRLPQELQCKVREMIKEIESDKATGRHVVWLRFTYVLMLIDSSNKLKESLTEFFQGEFLCYNSLLIFSQCVCSICCASATVVVILTVANHLLFCHAIVVHLLLSSVTSTCFYHLRRLRQLKRHVGVGSYEAAN